MKLRNILIALTTVLLFIIASGCGDKDNGDGSTSSKDQIYYCPMHPHVTSDKPGVCPICHMDLVLKGSGEEMDGVAGVIDVGDNTAILANLKTIKVTRESMRREIRVFSTIQSAEDSKKTISARFNGRIEKLFADKTGSYISKGDPLFEIYSPELIQAQNDLLLSKENENLLSLAVEKLKLLGLTESQINNVQTSGIIANSIKYFSPYSGIIMEKKIQEGMYINEGNVLYDLSDLSSVWNIADVYESDIKEIKKGTPVRVTVQSYPGEFFEGKVDLVYPVIDSKTRTIKVRSLMSNKGGKLKPNMYGETIFYSGEANGIIIPSEAVLLTGDKNLVYVKTGKGKFTAREVILGSKLDGKYEIVSGLKEGEEIAYSGAYLLDSEAQLRRTN